MGYMGHMGASATALLIMPTAGAPGAVNLISKRAHLQAGPSPNGCAL